ncbi:MAG: M48 family metalloprotease [Terriglobia bacterium]
MKWKVGRLVGLLLAAVLVVPTTALAAERKGKERPKYSKKDKKLLAKIAQRPEVQQAIERAWEDIRRQDMEFAYNVNTSMRFGELWSHPRWSEFRAKYGQLYNNPILQEYVNRRGQRLVPQDSPNLYAFRLLLDPTPRAEALSTGTIFISTGLVSLLDNEAQLAYILAHEIAHVERRHAYQAVRNAVLDQELAKEKQVQAQKKRALFSIIGAAAGAAVGGAVGGSGQWAMMGAMAGMGAGYLTGAVIYRSNFTPTEWDIVHENEADEAGLQLMLEQKFDPREVPKLYARLENLVNRDARVGLGFMGSKTRVRERTAHIQSLLVGTMKATIETRLQEVGLVGSTPEFALLMSALKRDNGVIALDYDLFAMAKDNLEEAGNLRSNDPRVHYYLGRLVSLTGRTAEERQQAVQHFLTAIRYDAERGSYPEPHLQHALHLIAENNPANQEEVQRELKSYVTLYQRAHGGQLPPNMHIIYDYFLLAGDASWYVPPVSVVSTKNVDPLEVSPIQPAAPPVTPVSQPEEPEPPQPEKPPQR